MKISKIIISILTVVFMLWGLIEQTETHPKIWVQVIGVVLFFYAMMRLMEKTPSNFSNREQNDIKEKE